MISLIINGYDEVQFERVMPSPIMQLKNAQGKIYRAEKSDVMRLSDTCIVTL